MPDLFSITTGSLSINLSTAQASGSTLQVSKVSAPPPAPKVQYQDRSEGQLPSIRNFDNREVGLTVELGRFANRTALHADLSALLEIIGSLQRVGGTLTWTHDGLAPVAFDVLTATTTGPALEISYYVAQYTPVDLTLTCLPFARGAETKLGTATGPSGSRAVLVDNLQVSGDVPALARVEFSGATQSQASLVYGLEQQASTGPLELAASSRRLGTSTLATQAGSVSTQIAKSAATSSNVPAGTWQGMLYLASSANAPVMLAGSYRVLVRVSCASGGQLRLRLRWAAGTSDGSLSTNPVWASTPGDWWEIADLGVVTIPADVGALTGIIERQTPYTADTHLDRIMFVPTERSGFAQGPAQQQDGLFVLGDSLSGSGNLGSSPGWTGSGSAPDFARGTSGATRSAMYGSFRFAGTGGGSGRGQFTLRATATTDQWRGNVAVCVTNLDAVSTYSQILSGNTVTTPASTAYGAAVVIVSDPTSLVSQLFATLIVIQSTSITYTEVARDLFASPTFDLRVSIDGASARGIAANNMLRQALERVVPFTGVPTSGMYSGVMSGGATLYSGGAPTANPVPLNVTGYRSLQNPPADYALPAGRIARVTSSNTTRQGSDAQYGVVSRYAGDRPFLTPSGTAGTPSRLLALSTRDALGQGLDANIDSYTVNVYATARYLEIPTTTAGGTTPPPPSSYDGGSASSSSASTIDGGTA